MTQDILRASGLEYTIKSDDIFSPRSVKTLWKIDSLNISTAGIVLLAGRNGVGKSTLLRCLLGLMKPTRGSIRWFGEQTAPRGVIGYLPELPVLPARVKVAEIVSSLLGIKTSNLLHKENRIADFASLDIASLLDRPAHLLSKGQQQKLLLTLAIASTPKGFVLDEPFSGLDPWARADLADFLVQLGKKDHFLLISSHDAPQRMRSEVRETWIIENESLTVHPGCAIPE